MSDVNEYFKLVTYTDNGTYVAVNDYQTAYLLAEKYFVNNNTIPQPPFWMQEIPNWTALMEFTEEHVLSSVRRGKMYSLISRECNILLATNSEELFRGCVNNFIGKMIFEAFEDENYIAFSVNMLNRGF